MITGDDRILACTDDDEIELAYFFLPSHAGEQAPDRLAYLLHESFPLPSSAVEPAATFVPPMKPGTLAPAGTGEGTTYAVLLTFHDGFSIGWLPPVSISGVRLPGLADYLRETVPDGGRYAFYTRESAGQEKWPAELLALRALVAPEDVSVEAALHRLNQCSDIEGFLKSAPGVLHPVAHQAAMAELAAATRGEARSPERTVIDVTGHIAQMSMHASSSFGYQQWYLFDDIWADAHPDLAASLMRYAADWNPYA